MLRKRIQSDNPASKLFTEALISDSNVYSLRHESLITDTCEKSPIKQDSAPAIFRSSVALCSAANNSMNLLVTVSGILFMSVSPVLVVGFVWLNGLPTSLSQRNLYFNFQILMRVRCFEPALSTWGVVSAKEVTM